MTTASYQSPKFWDCSFQNRGQFVNVITLTACNGTVPITLGHKRELPYGGVLLLLASLPEFTSVEVMQRKAWNLVCWNWLWELGLDWQDICLLCFRSPKEALEPTGLLVSSAENTRQGDSQHPQRSSFKASFPTPPNAIQCHMVCVIQSKQS